MTWNGGNGQQQQRKIPDVGKGRLRKTREIKRRPDGTQSSPDFNGLINFEGQIVNLSIWFEPAKQAQNGQMMPESYSVRASRYVPDQQGQGQAQGAQQGYQQAAPQQNPPQGYYAPNGGAMPPQGGYQAQPQQQGYQAQPQNGGGYRPAPGYVPNTAQPQQQQGRSWGGGNGQPQQQQGGGAIPGDQIPF